MKYHSKLPIKQRLKRKKKNSYESYTSSLVTDTRRMFYCESLKNAFFSPTVSVRT